MKTGLDDGRVELFQQLLRQVELPKLAEEIQPLLGLFRYRVISCNHIHICLFVCLFVCFLVKKY